MKLLIDEYNEDFAYFLGALLSDGYVNKEAIKFVTTDEEFKNEFMRCFCSIVSDIKYTVRETQTGTGKKCWRFQTTNKKFRDFITSIDGMMGGSYNKYIPLEIMNSPKSVIIACIQGMYDGDGSSSPRTISYTSCSTQMLVRLQILLDKFGIRSNIRGEKSLLIHGISMIIFLKEIGFRLTRKQNVWNENDPTREQEFIPYLSKYLTTNEKTSVIEDAGHRSSVGTRVRREMENGHDYPFLRCSSITDKVINTLKPYDEVLANTLSIIKDNNLTFRKVVSKYHLGFRNVYDLTEPNTHSYVANNMVSHNSNVWVWKDTLSDIIENGSITIKQIKARNQNPCDIKLRVNLACSQYCDYVEDMDNNMQDNIVDKSLGKGFDTSSDVPD